MKTKRHLAFIGVALALFVTIVAGTALLLPARPGLNKANFGRVEMGMSRDEVERILGQPTGELDLKGPEYLVVWVLADGTQGHVAYANGRVTHTSFRKST